MTKLTVIVTGATSGIGKATATQLAGGGARVIAVARDSARGRAAVAEIRERIAGADIELRVADLADLDSVRALAARVDQVDVLINNAAVAKPWPERTPAGLDVMLATNHLGPFLLTNLLLPKLTRVVTLGSSSHKQVRAIPWDDLVSGSPSYPLTKALNILFSYELARRTTRVTSNCADPGFVHTNLGRDARGGFALFLKLTRPFQADPEVGATTPVYLATSPDVAGTTGTCYAKCRPVATSPLTNDPAVASRLWELSTDLVGLGRPSDRPA
jgi:NAD(P)-dependent dehydrogenase (short-subunit alcohol dehydrogenase family)